MGTTHALLTYYNMRARGIAYTRILTSFPQRASGYKTDVGSVGRSTDAVASAAVSSHTQEINYPRQHYIYRYFDCYLLIYFFFFGF